MRTVVIYRRYRLDNRLRFQVSIDVFLDMVYVQRALIVFHGNYIQKLYSKIIYKQEITKTIVFRPFVSFFFLPLNKAIKTILQSN